MEDMMLQDLFVLPKELAAYPYQVQYIPVIHLVNILLGIILIEVL